MQCLGSNQILRGLDKWLLSMPSLVFLKTSQLIFREGMTLELLNVTVTQKTLKWHRGTSIHTDYNQVTNHMKGNIRWWLHIWTLYLLRASRRQCPPHHSSVCLSQQASHVSCVSCVSSSESQYIISYPVNSPGSILSAPQSHQHFNNLLSVIICHNHMRFISKHSVDIWQIAINHSVIAVLTVCPVEKFEKSHSNLKRLLLSLCLFYFMWTACHIPPLTYLDFLS